MSITVYVKRVRTEDSINAFKNDLLLQNWNIVYEENIDKHTKYS